MAPYLWNERFKKKQFFLAMFFVETNLLVFDDKELIFIDGNEVKE